MFGVIGLEQNLAGFVGAPGTPGYLDNQMGHAFTGAKVGTKQALIGIEDTDQGNAREVVALGQHLCTDE